MIFLKSKCICLRKFSWKKKLKNKEKSSKICWRIIQISFNSSLMIQKELKIGWVDMIRWSLKISTFPNDMKKRKGDQLLIFLNKICLKSCNSTYPTNSLKKSNQEGIGSKGLPATLTSTKKGIWKCLQSVPSSWLTKRCTGSQRNCRMEVMSSWMWYSGTNFLDFDFYIW